MIEALLHGKLTTKQENMEDILTSNVFGALQHVPPEIGLFPFLSRSKTLQGERPLKDLNGRGECVEYHFWPRWRHCEPDVELVIDRGNGWSYLVGIEAKYWSGKSSTAVQIEGQTEEGRLQECKDQLIREWNDLVMEALARKCTPVLVYLTEHVSIPTEEIQESIHEFEQKSPLGARRPVICWLSWRELPQLFRGHPNRLLAKVAEMAEYMGLTFFRGVAHVGPVRADWRFRGPPPAWHFEVPPITSSWGFQEGAPRWFSPVAGIRSEWRFHSSLPPWCFKAAPINSRWRFQRSAPAWHFRLVPIKSEWRFRQ